MAAWVRIEISEAPGRQDAPSFVLQHQIDVDHPVRVPYGDEIAAATEDEKAAYRRYALEASRSLYRMADGLASESLPRVVRESQP